MQNQNKSLTKGLQVLKEFLYSNEATTANALCQKLDIDKSTMSRLITTLMSEGFIQYVGSSKEIVKADILNMINNQATQEELIKKTQALLEKMFDLTQEASYLGILDNKMVLYLNQVDNSSRVIKMRSSVGHHAPLHCSAFGKTILAFSNIEAKSIELIEYTPYTHKKTRLLQEELEDIKRRGYAIENEEYEYGLSSLAVPLFDKENNLLGTVGVAGLTARLSTPTLHELGVVLSRLCQENL